MCHQLNHGSNSVILIRFTGQFQLKQIWKGMEVQCYNENWWCNNLEISYPLLKSHVLDNFSWVNKLHHFRWHFYWAFALQTCHKEPLSSLSMSVSCRKHIQDRKKNLFSLVPYLQSTSLNCNGRTIFLCYIQWPSKSWDRWISVHQGKICPTSSCLYPKHTHSCC